MCRKQDPQSKGGRIENVVGFVKKNFAKHRTFFNLERLNEDCLAWLERTGNGKKTQYNKENTGRNVRPGKAPPSPAGLRKIK